MAELDAAKQSPPIPPNDNSDRLDREPARLAEKDEGVTPPSHPPITREVKGNLSSPNEAPKARRVTSEKQLETLRKARDAKVAKARGLHPSPITQSRDGVKDDGVLLS